MKTYLPLPIIYLMATITMGQGYIGPSPNATAMIRHASVGVSHYTGAANISIPLADLTGRELGVSASLSYNSFGHRVQDIASSEGLGWTLAVGGMITRVVRGEPDDGPNGFCKPNPTDTEPDLFTFSFMGRSGKFVLDKRGVPIIFPYQDLKIVAGICGSGRTWEITDESGTRYRFGESALSREITTYSAVNNKVPPKNFVSTWYLDKVTSLNGTDEIGFHYISSQITYTNYLFTKEDGCVMEIPTFQDISSRTTVSSKYISSIRTSGGAMVFLWNNHREDIVGGKSLAGVHVADLQGNVVKKLKLEYSYFQSCATQLCKRLKLDAIYDLSPDPLYTFIYNTVDNLPARDSKDIDYLGLYNYYLIPNNTWIPYDASVDASGTYGSRTPSPSAMQANLLQRIDHRAGGYTSFYFQPHQGYFNGQLKEVVSGNRISLIVKADGWGSTQRTWYNYTSGEGSLTSSGLLFRLPIFEIKITRGGTRLLLKRYSHAYNEMFDVNGTHIGYSRVEEEIEGKGKIVYKFSNYDKYPDTNPKGELENGSPPFVSVTSRFWERGNLLEVTVMDLENRLVSKETHEYTFDHPIKNQLIASKSLMLGYHCTGLNLGYVPRTGEYAIISKPFTRKRTTTEHYDQQDPSNSRKITNIEEYTYDSITYHLTKTSRWNAALASERYETVNKFVTHRDYSYSPAQDCAARYSQCLQTCVDASCTNRCTKEFSGCLDQSVSDERGKTIQSLKARHANNILVEQQNWINRNGARTLLGAVLSLYKFVGSNGDIIVQATSWVTKKVTDAYSGSRINSSGQFVQPPEFTLSNSFDAFDTLYIRPLQETSRHGVVTAYTWSHNQPLLERVTLNPGAEEMTKSYEYKQLVGLTKITDTNGRSISHEYDHQGRIRLVRDHQGNIRERYRHHYRNESAGFRLRANNTQALSGQVINFTIEDIVLPSGGTPEFTWDMGNGAIYNDNRQSTSQSYSDPGLYTVKVVLFTNEFEPYTVTEDILVTGSMDVTLCADGPQWIDLCYQDPVIHGSCTVNNNLPSSPTVFHANFNTLTSTGCIGQYNYKWEYKKTTDKYWIPINSLTSSAIFPPQNEEGEFEVRCTVTDGCNNRDTATSYVRLYRSSLYCLNR